MFMFVTVQKCGRIWCSSFDNMQVLIFNRLEMRIHNPKIGVFGVFHPHMGLKSAYSPLFVALTFENG